MPETKILGYSGSKAALNMLIVQLAAELKDSGIKVNSAEPGNTAAGLNDRRGTQTVADGAVSAVLCRCCRTTANGCRL